MNYSSNFKLVLCCLLVFFALNVSPLKVVQAETGSDKYISDCLGKDNDCDEEFNSELNTKVTDTGNATKDDSFGLSLWDYVKTFFALLFVIALLFALLKFINRKNRMFNQHRLMKNIGGLSLGQNKSIQLVVIGETYFIIGVGDEVRLLKEIIDPEEIKVLESYFEAEEEQSPITLIDKVMTMLKSKSESREDQPVDFGKLFTSRLDEIREERKKHLNRLEEKENRKDE
ncbi:flagellar biosynthetic protein FliO [Sporosarcina highlanderae]|uniref:Flagellar biosynthetic protein FliO n=1 Tax=Sporosarcina highlanderae TaxID=3035916 RepID=A0ABT8JR09_9BACL|nr:flagellar biosynthetic protein FliO [Sporosarcina highlanderae]MDN4607452.1 flagellar biosynthetic protein FliO [Sporosarcina highlanderae]